MSIIGKLREKWKAKRERKSLPSVGVTREQSSNPAAPPIIDTPWGPTTESARLRAALNMRENPDIKRKVEELLSSQFNNKEAGVAESRRRYPEAYQ